jgi:hypothetical protein
MNGAFLCIANTLSTDCGLIADELPLKNAVFDVKFVKPFA